jgi:hypothetical protein
MDRSSSGGWHHHPPTSRWYFKVFWWVIRFDLTAYLNYNNRFISIGKWYSELAFYYLLIEYLMRPSDFEWMKISKSYGSTVSLKSIDWIAIFSVLYSYVSSI